MIPVSLKCLTPLPGTQSLIYLFLWWVGRCSMEPPAAGFASNPGCLDNAELNSTLALKVELLSLQVHAVLHIHPCFHKDDLFYLVVRLIFSCKVKASVHCESSQVLNIFHIFFTNWIRILWHFNTNYYRVIKWKEKSYTVFSFV